MVIHLFALKCVCQGAVCEKRIRPSKEWIRMDGKFTLALSRQALVKALSTTGRGGKFPFLTNGSDHSQLRQRSIKRLCSSRMFSETGRLSVNFTSTQTVYKTSRPTLWIPEEQKMKKKKKEEKAPLLSSTNERSVFFVAQLSGEESFRRSVAKVKKGSPMTLGIGGIETKKKSRGQRRIEMLVMTTTTTTTTAKLKLVKKRLGVERRLRARHLFLKPEATTDG
ncbi:hypothetical protein T4B_9367 [Trichinella pseudospiralis]|uniref:Uncharacterized protein n=1 Tax=Trichinella pseudospiralis TaxID=6337 RepID=A0A0V1J536_TRIPS|nr:hypothetical protein T4B_9367 [Trichinella pseudospiralis]